MLVEKIKIIISSNRVSTYVHCRARRRRRKKKKAALPVMTSTPFAPNTYILGPPPTVTEVDIPRTLP